jgi:FAD-dependent urate hydroxylase
MSGQTNVTVVGAGPFGLSIAAHLRKLKVDYRMLGKPMESWKSNMPKGMLLKSAGFSTNLSDPERSFTLRQFCRDCDVDYEDIDLPIPLDRFLNYGLEFQRRLVPDVESEELESLDVDHQGFEVRTRSGVCFRSRKVVVAVGLDYFRHVPEPLAHLPSERVSHAAEHHDLEKFQGRRVVVLGSGASAIDTAVLLHEAHVPVQLIARKPAIIFSGLWGGSGRHPILKPILFPTSGIGPGWKHRLFADLPSLFRYLPRHYRLRTGEHFPSPSGGLPMRDRAAHVSLLLGYSLEEARASNAGVQLRLSAPDGSSRTVEADHVIAATGYNADVRRIQFLSSSLVKKLRLVGRTPRLSVTFESSVPGLYFVGPISATTFGPAMRFVYGADFTARRISAHLARKS